MLSAWTSQDVQFLYKVFLRVMLRVDIPSRDGSFVSIVETKSERSNYHEWPILEGSLFCPTQRQYATIEEVQAALPSDVPGLSVDDGLRYPCVRFPENASNETMQKVKKHLRVRDLAQYISTVGHFCPHSQE